MCITLLHSAYHQQLVMRRKTSEINDMHELFHIRKALSLNHALNDMLEGP